MKVMFNKMAAAAFVGSVVGFSNYFWNKLGEKGCLPMNAPWISPSRETGVFMGTASAISVLIFKKPRNVGIAVGLSGFYVANKALQNSIESAEKNQLEFKQILSDYNDEVAEGNLSSKNLGKYHRVFEKMIKKE